MSGLRQDARALQHALEGWRKEPSDEAAQRVIAAGATVSKHYAAADWGLARFDTHTLTPVVRWLERADEDLVLPCLRHLETLLPDPRATWSLMVLLKRELKRPIDRAMVAACLQKNADPREPRLAEQLAVGEPWRTVRAADGAWQDLVSRRDARLAEMFSRPDDLSLRRVTADWLLEHGDPYGELIVLQLQRGADRPPSAQETELLRAHSRAWLHDFFHQEGIREVRFEGGVPVHARVASELAWRPACASIESLELVGASSTWRWLLAPEWKRVARVRPMPTLSPRQMLENPKLLERFRPVLVSVNDAARAAELLICRDGGLELFVHRGAPPFALVATVQRLMRCTRFELSTAIGEGSAVPPWLTGAVVVHRLQPHEVAARSLQRRKAEE